MVGCCVTGCFSPSGMYSAWYGVVLCPTHLRGRDLLSGDTQEALTERMRAYRQRLYWQGAVLTAPTDTTTHEERQHGPAA